MLEAACQLAQVPECRTGQVFGLTQKGVSLGFQQIVYTLLSGCSVSCRVHLFAGVGTDPKGPSFTLSGSGHSCSLHRPRQAKYFSNQQRELSKLPFTSLALAKSSIVKQPLKNHKQQIKSRNASGAMNSILKLCAVHALSS